MLGPFQSCANIRRDLAADKNDKIRGVPIKFRVDRLYREAVTQISPALGRGFNDSNPNGIAPGFGRDLGQCGSMLLHGRDSRYAADTTPLGLSHFLRGKPRVAARRGNPGLSCKTTSRFEEPQHHQLCKTSVRRFIFTALCAVAFSVAGSSASQAQNPAPNTETLKKANTRPAEPAVPVRDPFDGATVEKMTGQCVTFDTESGEIVIEMLPAKAPETVRTFLNLAASGALDTTVFSRVVKAFVIQGGNLSTSEKWNAELAERMSRHLPDEPSDVKHVRGIVSMARGDEPNSATTHFFILVGDGPHLDGKFAAFGRVLTGLEVADAINRAPAEAEKPVVPVRIKHAGVAQCKK
jgi:peptidyl-prolyl cis-trans isomerase B (cyclophilin B)